jgi:hypothetical protein
VNGKNPTEAEASEHVCAGSAQKERAYREQPNNTQ